jgi:hydrogenase nickel incorporation protein HypA/HybF
MSIVEALIRQVGAELEQSRLSGRVLRLDLAIGRMCGVHADCFRFAFEMLSPGTIVEGAELRIDEPRAVLRCRLCGAAEQIEELVVQCPRCGGDDIEIEGGQDLLLQSIELAEGTR